MNVNTKCECLALETIVVTMILISTGVPRKTNTQPQHNHSPPQTKSHLDSEHSNSTDLDPLTNQLSGLSVAKAVARKPSESDSSSSEDGEDVLESAGVEGVDLDNVQAEPDGKAPIQLVSQVCKT